jgi:hypothetical protein
VSAPAIGDQRARKGPKIRVGIGEKEGIDIPMPSGN